MNRHRSLAPLSRDHQPVLQLAEGLKSDGPATLRSGLPESAEARAAHVLNFYEEAMRPHFAAEEKVLLPAVRGRDKALDGIIEKVLRDHAEIRSLLDRLRSGIDTEATFDSLGRALERHVRLEERELFERIQQVVPLDVLDEMAPRLEEATLAGAGPDERDSNHEGGRASPSKRAGERRTKRPTDSG